MLIIKKVVTDKGRGYKILCIKNKWCSNEFPASYWNIYPYCYKKYDNHKNEEVVIRESSTSPKVTISIGDIIPLHKMALYESILQSCKDRLYSSYQQNEWKGVEVFKF